MLLCTSVGASAAADSLHSCSAAGDSGDTCRDQITEMGTMQVAKVLSDASVVNVEGSLNTQTIRSIDESESSDISLAAKTIMWIGVPFTGFKS